MIQRTCFRRTFNPTTWLPLLAVVLLAASTGCQPAAKENTNAATGAKKATEDGAGKATDAASDKKSNRTAPPGTVANDGSVETAGADIAEEIAPPSDAAQGAAPAAASKESAATKDPATEKASTQPPVAQRPGPSIWMGSRSSPARRCSAIPTKPPPASAPTASSSPSWRRSTA